MIWCQIFMSKLTSDLCLSVCLYVYMYVYVRFYSTAVLPIHFTLGSCIVEDPKKRSSVDCEVVWMSDSRESCKQQYVPVPNRQVLNWHCISLYRRETCLTFLASRSYSKAISLRCSELRLVRMSMMVCSSTPAGNRFNEQIWLFLSSFLKAFLTH